jgi:uncharacterized membrane protein (GlpM family)
VSETAREPDLFDRLEEPPSLHPGKARQIGVREIGIRFVAGALTSVVAGVLTVAFGARIGGIMLAFPAILAASLTLIAEEEDREDAREDARGSAVGGLALGAFALVGTVLFGHLAGGAVLAAAAVAWLVVALGLYRLLWWR